LQVDAMFTVGTMLLGGVELRRVAEDRAAELVGAVDPVRRGRVRSLRRSVAAAVSSWIVAGRRG
jgi:hypothetical protein